ncbi:HET domain-containing protein [Fusarium sp. LHS14.1]|nr:HET domain-containing protein [Fusarium sp. LHS14.1]
MSSSREQSFCPVCHSFLSAYVQGALTDEVDYPLAPNFTSLELSAKSGCHLCQIVRQYCLYGLGDELLSENNHHISLRTLPDVEQYITYNTNNGYDGEPWPPWIYIGYGVARKIPFFLGSDQSIVPRQRRQRLECPEPIHQLLCTEDDQQNTHYSEQGIRAIITLAKGWLSTCREGHETCTYYSIDGGRDQQRTVPTRLIDVGNDERPARLRIVTEDDGNDIEYLTLSYAWGPATSSSKTTASNLGDMAVSLPKELPRTIHDAIIFTRAMGVRYLWVDALCILQSEGPDDEAHRADWHREAARFGHYYRNSVFTLAATGSTSSDKGLFLPRPGLSLQPKPLAFEGSGSNGKKCIIRTTSPDWATEIRHSPLAKRGWAKQERVLSTRLLHFTSNCVLWECNQTWATEADPSGLYTKREGDSSGDDDFISDYKTSTAWYSRRDDWLNFIKSYSRTKFTFPSDVLPALSGIASRLQSHTSQKYIAGIWEDHIPEAICWVNVAGSTRTFQKIQKLPSWSWASLGEGVGFFQLRNSMLKVQGWELRTDGARTSGHVLEARLRVRGHFRQINLTDLGLQPHPNNTFLISPHSFQNWRFYPPVCLDNMVARDLRVQDHPCLLIGTGGAHMEGEGGILILEAAGRGVDDVEAFRRIGFLTMVVDENWKVAEERLVDLL